VVVPKDGLPAGTPLNDSELHLLARLDATFHARSSVEYAKLLTDDFRFHFSESTDPVLVAMYGDNWGRDDETIALTNLFTGFTNTSGDPVPAASSIDLLLNGVQVADDTTHVDSLAYYRRIVVSRLVMSIEIPGTPEPTIYNVDARQEFYVVRGDAAVLAAGQAAQADRWYIRRWDDLALAFAYGKGPVVRALAPVTLGRIKSQFRQ
jgi:hypothetical protein